MMHGGELRQRLLAQRGSSGHPGRRVGWPQRRDATTRLRQMPGRPGWNHQAKDHGSPERQLARLLTFAQFPLRPMRLSANAGSPMTVASRPTTWLLHSGRTGRSARTTSLA